MAEDVFRMLVPDGHGAYKLWDGPLCSSCFRTCKYNSPTHIPPIGMDHAQILQRVDVAYATEKGLPMTRVEVHSSDPKNSDMKRIRVACGFCGSDAQNEGSGPAPSSSATASIG